MISSALRSTPQTSVARLLLWAGLLLAGWPAAVGWATTFSVNSTTDAVDAALGNGVCATVTGVCTLRAAIQEANAVAGPDTVTLIPGTYAINLQGVNEDAAATGDLDISGDLTLSGPPTGLTVISGNGRDRVFDVLGSATVTLSRITIQSGNANGSDEAGGGIRNAATLTLMNLAIRGNTALNGDGGGLATAGGGTTTLTNVTVSGNVAAARGGGIANDIGGTVRLTNVTLNNNSALTGGGIDNLGTAVLVNTIVANGPRGSTCSGAVVQSLGNNIDMTTSCFFGAPGDLQDTDPKLGPLQENTFTYVHPLLQDSPAIDTGDDGRCPPVDQRGALRPSDGDMDGSFGCDIGAYEAPGPVAFTPTSTPSPTATLPPPTATATNTPLPPTSTPTSMPPTVTPGAAAIVLSTVFGSPGDQITFTATLETGGAIVGSAQNDLAFDSEHAPIPALANGSPNCALNPEINKQPLFVFQPPGCSGATCGGVRAAAIPSFPVQPIADGSVLYTCAVRIAQDTETGEYPLIISRVRLSNPEGTPVAGAAGVNGRVVVVASPTATPTSTPTATASETPANTATASATASSTATPTPTATPSPSVTPTIACTGDCDGNGEVTVNEIITMVSIALGNTSLSACRAGDANLDGEITVNEIIAAVNNALNGCRLAAAAAAVRASAFLDSQRADNYGVARR